MTAKDPEQVLNEAHNWWTTEIIDIQPGKIAVRGYPIEQLIGEVGFAEMIWLMLRGELPTAQQASLLEAALVAAVDHGPHAPAIAISRMAVTCGLPMNGAMASALARAVRQARSALESGDRSAGLGRGAAAGSTRTSPSPRRAAGGTRPSRNLERLRRASRPVAPVRRVAHESHRWRRARVIPT